MLGRYLPPSLFPVFSLVSSIPLLLILQFHYPTSFLPISLLYLFSSNFTTLPPYSLSLSLTLCITLSFFLSPPLSLSNSLSISLSLFVSLSRSASLALSHQPSISISIYPSIHLSLFRNYHYFYHSPNPKPFTPPQAPPPCAEPSIAPTANKRHTMKHHQIIILRHNCILNSAKEQMKRFFRQIIKSLSRVVINQIVK